MGGWVGERRWAGALIACGAVGLFILAFYLSVYAVRGYNHPLGYDTARYLWRTNCVAAGGLSELRHCATTQAAIPSRVGYPLVSLLLSGVLRVSRYQLAAVIPAVAASAIALGGAGLIGWSIDLDAKRFAVIGVIAGVSPMVVAMADPEGYADTMLALAVALAALVAVAIVADRGEGYAAAVVLLAVATVIHAPTGIVLGGVVVVVGVLYAALAWSKRRRHDDGDRRVALRLASVLGGAVLVWGATLALAVRVRLDPYRAPAADLEEKLRSHWPRLGLPIGLPAAVAGALVLSKGTRPAQGGWPRRRFLLTILLAWIGVVAAALVAWFAGWKLPAHRFLLITLPLPLLGGVALLWLGERAEVRRRSAGVAAVATGCLVVAAAGYVLWARNAPPVLRSARLDVARAATSYVETLPLGSDVVVVTDADDANPDALAQTFRAVLPEERIDDVTFTSSARAQADRVVIVMRGFSGSFDPLRSAMAEREVVPGVIVLNGALPTQAFDPPRGPRLDAGTVELVGVGVASLLLLGAVGLGWASAALPGAGPLARTAVAPGIGLAVLVVDGLIVDAAGARIGGPTGIMAVLGSGLLGAALAVRHRLPLPVGGDRRRAAGEGRDDRN
jgi:hypothetical protein